MSFNIDEDITQALSGLTGSVKTIQKRALRAGRDYMVSELERNTPYETTSDRSFKAQREMDKLHGHKTVFKHMRDDIVYSGIDQYGHINIGFGKDTYWRVHFVELGTIHQAAQPFISNTVAQSNEMYQAIVQNELKKGLNI